MKSLYSSKNLKLSQLNSKKSPAALTSNRVSPSTEIHSFIPHRFFLELNDFFLENQEYFKEKNEIRGFWATLALFPPLVFPLFKQGGETTQRYGLIVDSDDNVIACCRWIFEIHVFIVTSEHFFCRSY